MGLEQVKKAGFCTRGEKAGDREMEGDYGFP